jgi:hypothetical protein
MIIALIACGEVFEVGAIKYLEKLNGCIKLGTFRTATELET